MFRIMKTSEFEDSIFYRASCSCGDSGCDLRMVLSNENDGLITLTFYEALKYYSFYESSNKFIEIFCRIKTAMKLFFTGTVKIEKDFIFDSPLQLEDFIQALLEGKKSLEKRNPDSQSPKPDA